MHHHLFPEKDTYISDRVGFADKNFGIDELLEIGTNRTTKKFVEGTKTYTYTGVTWTNYCVENFTGTLTGSLFGTASAASGVLSSSSSFSSSYFSGSIDGASISEISGGVSGSVNGSISGSLYAYDFSAFTGSLTSSSGRITGIVTGTDVRAETTTVTRVTKYSSRPLIKFDLTSISQSISNGEITNPAFKLHLKACREYELPLSYKIYAFPVSQSWENGNGYFSDAGSEKGVNWYYKDYDSGSAWALPLTTSFRPVVDFVTTSSNSTGSFNYGGGTWFYTAGSSSLLTSQSFSYQASDVNMDVTTIVYGWLSGSIDNQGFILISSDEIEATGSEFILQFYSKDTNTIYSPYLDIMWSDWSFSTGSLGTGSVTMSVLPNGFDSYVISGSSLTGSNASGSFSGYTFLSTDLNSSASGYVNLTGISGSINGFPIYGNITGSYSSSISASVSQSFVLGTFTDGAFSGSVFTASYTGYSFESGSLSGSWTLSHISGSRISASLPQTPSSYILANISGDYLSGNVMGAYTPTYSTSSGIFQGNFVDGLFAGTSFFANTIGNYLTSSYVYTASVNITSSVLSPLDISNAFVVYTTNLNPIFKGGDVQKIYIFGRPEYPLKSYEKASQQLDYATPRYLPSSSYYSIKDNLTEETIVDFDSYTQISCEYPTGNYFMLDTTGLPEEREYRILIRVENSSSKYTFDDNRTFKIVR